MQYNLKKISSIIFILLFMLFSYSSKAFEVEELEQFQNSHFEHIDKLCEDKDLTVKETCFLLNSGYFLKSISILNEKKGINYFNICYDKHYIETELKSYPLIHECTSSYSDLIDYPFLNKQYNYIFLEEDNIFLNMTNSCVSNREKNKDINDCIKKQKESFNFFKINFFNEINHSKEDAFRVCLKQHSMSKYNFDFRKINSCIKQNSF